MSQNKDKEPRIPFNRPYLTGRELSYIAEAHMNGQLAGDGQFTKRCQEWLGGLGNTQKALLTHSCTAAIEMAAILCDIQPGDEVIMPSYTFVSTANAFVLRGAIPVFVDIRIDTLNIDETKIEAAITSRTKAIVPVHYAGVACEMDTIIKIARRHGLFVIEDAAQGCMATYKGRYLGTIGDLGCLSFHETKNIISGEGGALLVNKKEMNERAEIIREKGTNRSKFIRGEVDKYTWTDVGSSFLPGEIIAAFLWAQLENAEIITTMRMRHWHQYELMLSNVKQTLRSPIIPEYAQHNGHIFHLLNYSDVNRDSLITELKKSGIHALFHYIPLHSSPYGLRNGKTPFPMHNTDYVSNNIIRLPLWLGMNQSQQTQVVEHLMKLVDAHKLPTTEMLVA